jgi:dipeptidyl aminopeptidase/acylaminoacyl peptidase
VLFALIFSWASVMIISPSRTESMTVRPEPRESNTSDGNQQTGLDKKTEESRKAAETNPWPKAIEDDGQPLPDGFRAAALSHDCQRLAIVSPNSEVLRVVAAPDATKLFEVDYHEYIWRAQFSPDGEYLAVRTYRGIKILSAAKGEELRRFANGCPNLAFSPDSERLAAESAGLHVWSASTGDVLANFPNHANWSWCVAFSPDGKLLASGSGRGNGQEDGSFAGEVRVWDLSTSSAIDFDGHPDRVSGLAFSPDGRWLASASYDRTVKVWELSTKKCLITFDKHEGAVGAVQFSPDGRLVASCGRDNPVRIWAPATGREIAALECPPGDYREDWLIQFSPAGRWIYSGKQSVLKVWETPEPDGEESVKTASTSGESNQEPDSAPEAVAEMPAEAEKVPETEEAPDPQQTSTTPEPTAVEVVEVANTAKAASTPATTATQPKPGTSVRKQTKNHVVASNRRARANQPPPVAGRWKHAASAPDANGGVIFTFVPDGSIRGPKGGLRGSWWQSGSMMVLRWPDKQAPGGAWVDRVELSPDRKRYDGFNQRRVAIHGLKVDR